MKNKLIFILVVIFLLLCPCILVLGALGVYTLDKSEEEEQDTIEDDSQDPKEITELIPINANNFLKTDNNDDICDLPNGVVTYSTEEFGDSIIISNVNLDFDEEDSAEIEDVIALSEGDGELAAENGTITYGPLTNDCFDAAYTYLQDFESDYNNTDASHGYVFFGGMHGVASTVAEVPVTITIYAKRGDHLIQVRQSFDGNAIFTNAEGNKCMTAELDNKYIDLECLKDIYLKSASKQQTVKNKSTQLLTTFALPN